MAQVLDKDNKTVLLKVSMREYQNLQNAGLFDPDNLDDYEFVFDTPVKASELLKTL
ncbi:hypothetical protein LAT59_02565 [Candidatus Gracilibacteria bacterium]|nr:hypothetical protein [Candidatus Gracilibacteria bacterium]